MFNLTRNERLLSHANLCMLYNFAGRSQLMNWQDILYYCIAGLMVVISAVCGAISTWLKNKAGNLELTEEEAYQKAIDDAITSAEALGVTGPLKLNYAKLQVKLYVLSCRRLDKTDEQIVEDIEARIAVTNAVNVNKSAKIAEEPQSNGEDRPGSSEGSSEGSSAANTVTTIQTYHG